MKVAILGAGPAGMTCANALLTFGQAPLVIERADHIGGAQRTNFHPNLWLLGNPEESGREMTERMSRHFLELPIPLYRPARLERVERSGGGFSLHVSVDESMHSLYANALVLATGMRPRATPELELLAARSARVIVGPLSDTIRDGIRNSRVLILGGGDNALDHALYLAERGNRAVVCARGSFSGRQQFQQACAACAEIVLNENCHPSELRAFDEGVEVDWAGGQTEGFDWLLVMYGYRPNTEVLEHFAVDIRPALLSSGHVRVDAGQRTSVAGVYAAGDITDSVQPSVATAIAQGLAAARSIERDAAQSQTQAV